jgi:NTP pyrophosphatase (non-canonical NTP hydrolase)
MTLTLNQYAVEAMRTAVFPIDRGLDYLVNGLTSEAGELAGHYAKAIRDDKGYITPERRKLMLAEAGDALWMLAGIAREFDTTLEAIAQYNLNKLHDRAQRNKIGGSGDVR